MTIGFNITKRIVHDIDAVERFYVALGFKIVERRVGDGAIGEEDVAQEQSRLSLTGDTSSHILVLARFYNLPRPARPTYPGEGWLVFYATDVDEAVRAAESSGGLVHRPAEDLPQHRCRAAIVCDPEGHFVEIFGPMAAS
jgi:hypothetical protein